MFGSYIKYILVVAISGLLLSGCATKEPKKEEPKKYSITYNSNPTGAAVVCNGVEQGYTPLTLYYTTNSPHLVMRTQPCTANWISGAKADYATEWDLGKFQDGVMQTLQRPNVDGYEKDTQFALQVQQMKAQQ